MPRDGRPRADDPPDVADLFDELEDLDDVVDDPVAQQQLEELKALAGDIQEGGAFGQVIYGFDRHDAAEAMLGSLLFGIPMAVEGGTNEAGAFVARRAWFLTATLAATAAIVYGVLYVAEFQDVRIADRLFGVIPRRFAGVLGVAFGTATLLLTAWGRVDWAAPWVAVCTISVAAVPMAIGAALGDILPGS
jgi:uncharacterized membrane protein